MRKCVARQVGPVARLYSPPQVLGAVLPVGLQLCADKVAAVRAEAVASMGDVLVALRGKHPVAAASASAAGAAAAAGTAGDGGGGDDDGDDGDDGESPQFLEAAAQITAFADEANFQRRQLFVAIAGRAAAVLPADVVDTAFGEGLVRLAADPVANVRIRIACLLHSVAETPLLAVERLRAARVRLCADLDEDVAYFAQHGGAGTTVERGDPVPSDFDDDGAE